MTGTYETASCSMTSAYGNSQLHVFSFGPHEEDNVLCIKVEEVNSTIEQYPLVRVQSACYTAEIFRSKDCDCHEQLDVSLRKVHSEGGAVIYMICDGRGAGLLTKIRGLALGDAEGLDTFDAYRRLGSPVDPRDYQRVAEVLRAINITSIRLLTNNPRKVDGLSTCGIAVEREPLVIAPTERSLPYLETKRLKMGHLLPEMRNP